ncbi:MAG: CoB--CoM heterodisulfide reductase iron-sulfur subunit A family protein, partial [Paludibacteraceae bacterium]|nr:CoB--CoM heterodisulfide reductase iron-sulfur subunit A family protein [Paludibacteraceae bacterium]
AGLEAAKQLHHFGYQVFLVEKSKQLGGHVATWHRLFPDMAATKPIINEMVDAIKGVTVFLETQVNTLEPTRGGYQLALSNGINITAKVVLMATGFQLFEAAKKEEYGYGIYDHVITNAVLEAWMNSKKDARIPASPKAIGFVHCVGSRDLKAGNSQCSKVCCMTAIKQAIEMKERYPNADVYCFYMDLRLFGKKYEDFYINAQRDFGIHFVRGRVSEVSETIDGRLQVKAEDTLIGKPLKVQLDLLVLMAGMCCNKQVQPLAEQAKLEIDSDGFLKSRDNITNIIESGREGIFFAGACTGTKTVPETVSEARAAALAIHNYLQDG